MPQWTRHRRDQRGVRRSSCTSAYRRDPASVDPATRARFEESAAPGRRRPPARAPARLPAPADVRAVVGAVNLAQSIRRYGHLAAQLDPLGSRAARRSVAAARDARRHRRGSAAAAGDASSPVPLAESPPTRAATSIEALRRIYCSTTGYDFAHIFVPEEREWLRQAVECGRFRAPADPIDPVALLDRLTQVEAFERFLQRTFPGKTRFSIEGLDMLVPILDEVDRRGGGSRASRHMLHRHGAPRPAERDGARAAASRTRRSSPSSRIRSSSRTFREDLGVDGRREVPRRRARARSRTAARCSWSSRCRRTRAISRPSIRCVEGMARAAGTRWPTPGAPRVRSGAQRCRS